jgi:4-hydroxy-tetrahydrodipicolinate synthase
MATSAHGGTMDIPAGAFAPIPTPLDEAGQFDEQALEAHFGWLSSQGLDGVLVLGTNGEFPSFSFSEREAIARAAVRHRGELQMMLNVGSCALPEVLSMVELAAEMGYDAVLCPPPFYFRSAPVAGLADFFRAVLDASELPVLLYHIPQVTGVPVDDVLLNALAGHPRLVGVKDSSGSPDELERLSARFRDGAYFVGNDVLTARCLASGGRGSISAAASVVPALVRSVDGDGQHQPLLNEVRALLEAAGLGASVKALLRHFGFGRYASRPPLRELSAQAATELAQRFEALAASYAP